MADRAPKKCKSPAYLALRASARRLLMVIETEIARQGGGTVTFHADQLAVIGSIRVILPGLNELAGLGLIDCKGLPKRYVIGLSDRWHNIATAEQAMSISAVARTQRMPPSQPASASA
jgi:hypothetical protein